VKIYISVKQIGKKRNYISDIGYEIPNSPITLADLIRLIVTEKVEEFNLKNADITTLLTQEDIEAQVKAGKIGFGRRHGNNADLQKSVDAALLAFSDGLYRVFIDEQEATALDGHLNIQEGSRLMFIRLTFLAGRMY